MTTRISRYRLPIALILLSAVPDIAGAFRLTQLLGGAPVTAENARFLDSPLPAILHIVCATVFSVLGAFQFLPSTRRTSWHRLAGRVVLPCGLIVALSGLWMTLFYALPPSDGRLLAVFRLIFGTLMAGSLILGFTTIRRRRIAEHRAWLIRGYAIGMGAGTQVFTTLAWVIPFGLPDEPTRALLLAAGWLINLAIAELAIRLRFPVRAAATS
ncbi:DUF2306 domain-containing protein [Actinokineospora enzanensis]|uniref:DUF2306 domain-containing protein n=1 Tax=Actinokineospora enzanensis TaxID=155975 RepID=UPI000377E2A8|nr:DUF2306 domain-containing protein [Actinokineospora enzanensis]